MNTPSLPGVALSDTLAPTGYFPPPTTLAPFVALTSSSAAITMVSVGNSTLNVAVAISFSPPFVMVNVTVYAPSFVATPVTAPFLSSYLSPAGSPDTATFQPSAFTFWITPERSGAAPASSSYTPSAAYPASLNRSGTRFGTVMSNLNSCALVTDAFVAFTVTVYTPGIVALPAIFIVVASYLTPAGRPVTVSFGSESDETRFVSDRSISSSPTAEAVTFVKFTVSLSLSSWFVTNLA